MSDKHVTLEINGKEIQAKAGMMLIQVADEQGIHIPRFCYHDKLSVAANCRMCLVEVEKAPKPMPACATPIYDGMKVLTHSVKAVSAQKAIMEFLLINHPLDCPICDQGGECELQDVSQQHGANSSEYKEVKRVVIDKDIGPLISTEMTRCIQCTRCVRFGEEIAGLREMGATGRSETMAIGTYVEKSLTSELSGNIIDICPVGALTAKPSRYRARAWEVRQYPSIASHDCLGSHINMHTFRNEVMRVVPRDNAAINECWLSDRDRFSYQGINADDRLLKPMVKSDGKWRTIDWDNALELVAEQLNAVNTDEVGVLASSRATTEELYLLQKLMRAKGINNIDHRLRQTDFTDQAKAPQFPWLGMPINALETVDAILLVGADIRHDQPMANHWLRKAALKGAKVSVLSSCPIDFNYPLDRVVITDPVLMVSTLGQVLSATGNVSKALSSLTPAADEQAKVLAETLRNAENAVILLGNQAVQHPAFSQLRALSAELASNTGATLSYLSESANTVGAWLTGIVPHRLAGGVATKTEGLHSADMLMSALKTLVLFDVEPTFDCDDPQKAIGALDHAKVIAFTSFASEQLRASVDILLPISTFAETSGTYINAEGKQQSFRGVAKAPADVKPGWRILRVLGGVLELDGFEYMSSKDVLDEFNQTVSIVPDNTYNLDDNDDFSALSIELDNHSMLQRIGAVHMYSGDSLVRRATALQKTFSIARDAVRIHPSDVKKLGISGEESVVIQQGDGRVVMSLVEDPSIPEGCVHLLSATSKATALGASYGHVTVQGGS